MGAPARLLLIALVPLVLTSSHSLAAVQQDDGEATILRSIDWQTGPCTGVLGGKAEVKVPAGMAFTGKVGAKKWLEATHNLPDDGLLGVVVPMSEDAGWWVAFEYRDAGHIPDDEKNSLDADAILKSISESNVNANEERRRRGWDELHVTGWERAPFFDDRTKNLTWAVRARGTRGESVNYSVRLLGREGYMSADLVIGPEELASAVGPFEALLAGFDYTSGNRYAEYRKGDKLASYGLTALVAGGAGAVAAKTGLLAKFWKFIVLGFVALLAGLRRFVATLFHWGKRDTSGPMEPK